MPPAGQHGWNERQMLMSALRTILLPALAIRGFSAVPPDPEDARSSEIRHAFPFGRFRRLCSSGFEQIEIQLDKRERTALRLNAAVVPREGITHSVGPVACEDVWIHYLDRFIELYRFAPLCLWFASPRSLRSKATQQDFEVMARKIAELLPVLEQALGDPAGGRWNLHLRRVRA
ncbi:MAG TPA: hypothetical protein VD932_06305 [Aquabacterium sp.]|nr:hypothetical protein [Aquabacterium sp.]